MYAFEVMWPGHFWHFLHVYAQSASQVLLSEVVDVPDKKRKLVHTNTNSYI